MRQVVRSLLAMLVLTTLLGFGYTMLITAIAQLMWADQADGSLVEHDGTVVGSRLLAQPFASEEYFWPRPSASGYNANPDLDPTARSLAYPSNLGPTHPDLIGAIADGVARYGEGVPVDLITRSGSGLDPHISVAAARWQAPRVASSRGVDESTVQALIDDLAEFWIGRRYVNVLELNLALDELES
ncbi:MAG TPA: K(+)-transporting ATPase subunit C [Acidimicrobiia bacterium]|nr:K(+)-transporting ATPase subunit C [Acidimicrobiia bacterium]